MDIVVSTYTLSSLILGPTKFPILVGFNTSDTSINVSWEHIPDQHWGDTPGGYIIEVTPPRESVGHTDITRLE